MAQIIVSTTLSSHMIKSLRFLIFIFPCIAFGQASEAPLPVGESSSTAAPELPKISALSNKEIYSSVVRIECSTQVFDYKQPWTAGRFGGGIGTGFLVGKNRFLTNAHVVSNARRIIINKRGSDIKHPARIIHIAHDCDLALIEVEDFSSFVGLPYLKIADNVPKLESEVRAVGYPVGGNRLSVTRGVVSRIDFRPYSHSQIDMHLIVQVDAAINPGNSGGPVLQGEEVVGVAFQGLRGADNTGFMIPVPVIDRFLKDIEDGQYNKYVDLGASHFPLFNPAMKKALGLPENSAGVLISDIIPDGACDGVLERGDVLVKIDGNLIDNAGNIEVSGEKVLLHEVLERKFAGDKVDLVFMRDGEVMEESITLVPFPASRVYAISYDTKPRYYFKSWLLFQPMDFNLFSVYKINNPSARHLYQNYIDDGIFKTREDLVVLTTIFDDKLTSSLSNFEGLVVKSINNTPVKSLSHLHELMEIQDLPDFLEIRFEGTKKPLILPTSELEEANSRISANQGITQFYNL